MAIINIVTTVLSNTKFTGGILCILEYANGLASRGHTVNIVPILPSSTPDWFSKDFGRLVTMPPSKIRRNLLNAILKFISAVISIRKLAIKTSGIELVNSLLLTEQRLLSPIIKKGLSAEYLKLVMPDADFTIATAFETAIFVYLYGKGQKFYFSQHYEPFFKEEAHDPLSAEIEAKQSYHLGLKMIVNSSWLRYMITSEVPGIDVALCPNAIDHDIFSGIPIFSNKTNTIKLISYGGRNAVWKGFREMAAAVSIAREEMPQYQIEWQVYGDAVLSPDNSIASYTWLGFLGSQQLAAAYRQADILLSASWYESFPLFPLEAMACGLPVITSQKGTEEYAIHSETAHIIEEKNPRSIATGLMRVIGDIDYRKRLAINGNAIAKKFNWNQSVDKLEDILLS